MKLSEWLSKNPAPFDVGLFTVKPGAGENPAVVTAGRVVFPADSAAVQDGVVVFYQQRDGEKVGELVLVEEALSGASVTEDGTFTADYVNLTVPVDEFHGYLVVTIHPRETQGKEAGECVINY